MLVRWGVLFKFINNSAKRVPAPKQDEPSIFQCQPTKAVPTAQSLMEHQVNARDGRQTCQLRSQNSCKPWPCVSRQEPLASKTPHTRSRKTIPPKSFGCCGCGTKDQLPKRSREAVCPEAQGEAQQGLLLTRPILGYVGYLCWVANVLCF